MQADPPPRLYPLAPHNQAQAQAHVGQDDTDLTPEVALRALVFAQGQPALAAERLGLRDADQLLSVLVMDETIHDQMRSIMRAFMMIRLLGVAHNLEQEVLGRMDELELKDIARLFTSVVTLADLMTKGATTTNTNINIQETVMRMLPPDVRQAFRIVTSSNMELPEGSQSDGS